MDAGSEQYLSKLLSNIRTIDNVAPQPSRSFMDVFYDNDNDGGSASAAPIESTSTGYSGKHSTSGYYMCIQLTMNTTWNLFYM